MNAQQIPKDKQLHFCAGATIGAWGYIIPGPKAPLWKPIVYSIGTSTIAGVGKELIDLGGFGTPEWRDLGWTMIGGVVSAGILTGIKKVIHIHKHRHNLKMSYNDGKAVLPMN